ncbi:MAG: hypothetical protein JO131_03790 [Gammaproteobacteria bacterium]|nr:hypothetical protein [Gammaproteobacteria bacterium]
MFKFGLVIFTILGISTSFAQTTLNFQNPKQSTQPGAPIPPSDFADQVKSTNAQKHTQFKQQLEQQKSALSHPQIPTLSQVQSMSQTPPPAMQPESNSTTNSFKTNTNKSKPNTSLPSSNTELTPADTQESTPATAPSNQGPSPTAQPSQTRPYTGFPQNQSNSTTPKNNGGFNIQY